MADFSLQLQADNIPDDLIEGLFVEGPWAHIISRMFTSENILLEGCRGAGKTMIMRAAATRMQRNFLAGDKKLGIHTTFKRYLATLPPPSNVNSNNPDLGNFRAWVNAKILGSVKDFLLKTVSDEIFHRIELISNVEWGDVISALESTYKGNSGIHKILADAGLSELKLAALQGYSLTSKILKQVKDELKLDLLVIFLDDAAHALDTRAQGAFFTAIKSLYEPGISFKIAVYPAVTRYGIDFSYGHDAIVITMGEMPSKDRIDTFVSMLEKRKGHAEETRLLWDTILANRDMVALLTYCANANPRGLLKLIAQVQTQVGVKQNIRFEDLRLAINFVMDRHLTSMVPGVIKDLDARLLKAAELLLDEFRLKISEKPGPFESGRPRGYLAITNSMQVPYLCQAALKLLVAANVVVPESPARLSKRETGTLYLLHPGFIFRDNVIGGSSRGTLGIADWLGFFYGMSSRVHAEITKGAEFWSEIYSEANSEPSGLCENGHPLFDNTGSCPICGTPGMLRSPVDFLLNKDLTFLELSESIKDRLFDAGYHTVRQLYEATAEQLDAVDYIGEKRVLMIKYAVSSAVDEFISG
jgi:hypothetical protein